ncbi:transmembrane protein DUF3566 [Haloactinospora alba]|uniref:Transmembrane protein DUF3566 n=1 Tax=Haloactinospora alba TaxID=405555 RepID=A0A543N9U2_9ACTN|nr:DUF3566 domain-containing protein [Haloactinospora alba]TQN28597.1 transmembrane protein DUF3566 [Haloactinospora alba]
MSDNTQGESATPEANGGKAPSAGDGTPGGKNGSQKQSGSGGAAPTAGSAAAGASAKQGAGGNGPSAAAPKNQGPAVKATTSTRKAHLTVGRVEPWSVMKFSFVTSLVCFIILFVAVGVIYAILSGLGVFDAVSDVISSLTDGGEGEEVAVSPENWFSPARVLGYTGLIGALNIILITALSTVAAMLYNLAADLVGGIDVTLSETE